MHSGRARGVCKRGSEDVLLIEVAPGLLTGFWESQGESCCYCCWWDLKVHCCEPCRTGGNARKTTASRHASSSLCYPHRPLPSFALTALFNGDTLTNEFGDLGSCPNTGHARYMISSLPSPIGNPIPKRSFHHVRLFTALVEPLQGTRPELNGDGDSVPEHLQGSMSGPSPV